MFPLTCVIDGEYALVQLGRQEDEFNPWSFSNSISLKA